MTAKPILPAEQVLGPNRHPNYQGTLRPVEASGSYAHPGHWTCFHCGETFVNTRLAAQHFGADPSAEPGCMMRLRNGERHSLTAVRDAEAAAAVLRKEVERLKIELEETKRVDDEMIRHNVARVEALEKALSASVGYLLNAKIDLETGAPKKTAIQTIEGGIKTARAALGAQS